MISIIGIMMTSGCESRWKFRFPSSDASPSALRRDDGVRFFYGGQNIIHLLRKNGMDNKRENGDAKTCCRCDKRFADPPVIAIGWPPAN